MSVVYLYTYNPTALPFVVQSWIARLVAIEKYSDKWLQNFINKALAGMSYDLFEDCPDPIADEDESDVYREKLDNLNYIYSGDYSDCKNLDRSKAVHFMSFGFI